MYIYFDAIISIYRVSKIKNMDANALQNIIGITFQKKFFSLQTEKLTFLKIAAKLATSRSLLWGSIFLSGLSLLLTNLSLKLPT